jgi:hypothetical protein
MADWHFGRSALSPNVCVHPSGACGVFYVSLALSQLSAPFALPTISGMPQIAHCR